MILNEGELDGKRYLRSETCRAFTMGKSAVSHRGLGYDKPNLNDPKANACAPSAPASVYGHTGLPVLVLGWIRKMTWFISF